LNEERKEQPQIKTYLHNLVGALKDDLSANFNPGTSEVPNNGVDEDCDGEDLKTTSTHEIDGKSISIYPNPFQSEFIINNQTGQSYS
jgi:hypothetical protein